MRLDPEAGDKARPVGTPDRSADLLAAIKAILRPLVKAMVARGVTLGALVDALKEIYVDVAETDFELDGKRSTDSRISILTGVHRKDVRAIRTRGSVAAAKAAALGVSATVIGRWLGDPDFADPGGAPRALPRQRVEDGPASFEELVQRVSKDVRPRTVLDELERLGLVTQDAEADTVSLIADAFVPRQGEAEMLHFFKMNLADHAAAATENLLAEPGRPPFFERVVYYSHLSPSSVDVLEARARKLAGEALIDLNKSALALQRADEDDPDACERFRFGAFFFRLTEAEAEISHDSADEIASQDAARTTDPDAAAAVKPADRPKDQEPTT